MKKMLKYAALLMLPILLSTLPAQAQKYGHLNLGNLLEAMPERQAADEELAELRDTKIAEGEEMVKKLDAQVKKYQKDRQAGLLNQIQIQEKEAELQKMNQEIVQFEQQLQADLSKKRQELLGPILKRVEDAVTAVAEDNGYIMIFDTSVMNAVLFAEESEDVMELVKKKLGME